MNGRVPRVAADKLSVPLYWSLPGIYMCVWLSLCTTYVCTVFVSTWDFILQMEVPHCYYM